MNGPPGPAGPVIRVQDLHKTFRVALHHRGALGAVRNLVERRFKEVRAVDGIGFAIQRGEMVGCLGPNGAGKSTTIKMLTGILTPSVGDVEVLGLSPQRKRKEVAARIGVVFGQRTQLWWDLPLIESLDLLRYVYRVPAERYRRNLDTFRALLDLDSFLNTPVRQLSLGQRMRGDLAASLLHDPEILYLDEPTIGLDVVAKHRMRDFLREINRERGVTVLLTTHDMADVEQLCSRLLIVDRGRLLYDGSLREIRDRLGTERTLVVDLTSGEGLDGSLNVPNAREVRADGPRRWLRFDRKDTTASDLIAAVASRYRLQVLTIEEPEIEEIVRRIYEKGLDLAVPVKSAGATL
ncbi:MAG TPA: ATP-binding cassette domain-containing protein [Chloroflexota bacterium]|nr:ATP-binding cassette domain-containing protein [Chloroflexota bacterium]